MYLHVMLAPKEKITRTEEANKRVSRKKLKNQSNLKLGIDSSFNLSP